MAWAGYGKPLTIVALLLTAGALHAQQSNAPGVTAT